MKSGSTDLHHTLDLPIGHTIFFIEGEFLPREIFS